jgi:hypothetical protein
MKTMTLDKDRKRIIRTRMKTTGESYTTARQHVVARAAKRSAGPAATSAPARVVDHGRVAGKSDPTIKQRTGYDWQEWLRLLDAEDAAALTHRDRARIIHEKYGVPGWWSQTVAVGYERLKGLRERGQRMSGAFEASKSKTFSVPVSVLYDAWADNAKRQRWLQDVDPGVRTAKKPKSMRLQWPDGTVVAVWFTGKGDGKSAVALAHMKLTSRTEMEKAKTLWESRLEALKRLLSSRR